MSRTDVCEHRRERGLRNCGHHYSGTRSLRSSKARTDSYTDSWVIHVYNIAHDDAGLNSTTSQPTLPKMALRECISDMIAHIDFHRSALLSSLQPQELRKKIFDDMMLRMEHFCDSPPHIKHHISKQIANHELDDDEPNFGLWKAVMMLFFETTIQFQTSFTPYSGDAREINNTVRSTF